MRSAFFLLASVILFASGCTPTKKIGRAANQIILQDSSLKTAHVGISIFEPATAKFWYNHQGDKYFVPASNTKIAACYAAMKYLGDSLVGLNVLEYSDHIFLRGTGDPTFLHEDYAFHPVYHFINSLHNSPKAIVFGAFPFQANPWGSGWAWNDYDASYMAERSAFPMYGNVVSFAGKDSLKVVPHHFLHLEKYSRPGGHLSRVERPLNENKFKLFFHGASPRTIRTPFVTSLHLSHQLLTDTIKQNVKIVPPGLAPPVLERNDTFKTYLIHSQHTDSMLKPMMHRSDNFFAEQCLLMVSNEVLGVMNDAKIIDTILKTDFKELPQKPRWADGSGLSRYNLFTPQDFIFILNKMKSEFGMQRVKEIFPTGNEGTLSSYYRSSTGNIFAKTGTLSGVVALSGFLYTRENKLLIFSVLVNNHQASAAAVRRAVEKFIEGIRERY